MRILIAVENEDFAEAQVDFVCAHKWTDLLNINVLHVAEPISREDLPDETADRLLVEIDNMRRARGEQLLHKCAARLRKGIPGVAVQETLHQGYPKEVIISEAEQWEADTVIVGSHGRKELSRSIIGSVSAAVLAYAPCSVMVIRPPQPKKLQQVET